MNARFADKTDRIDAPTARSRRGALALTLAAVFALGAGEAAAQDSRVCDNAYSVLPAGTTEERFRELSGLRRQGAIAESPHVSIYCRYGRADDNNRGILVHNPQIVVVDDFVPGIEAFHEGVGDVSIFVHAVSGEPGSAGDFLHPSPADYGQGIFTTGNAEDYLTGEDSYGIHVRHTGEGRAGIDVRNVSVRTTGDHSHGVYAWQQGSYRLDEDGNAYRAPGAVIVNLIETDRDRDQRVRPLVATSGDDADAIRAQYTRAAARGHIAVTVEGYTLATGGTLPLEALVNPQDPGAPLEVASPQDPSTYVFDPSRPSVPNQDYDPDDPRSSRFINVLVHPHRVDDAGNRLEAVDLRPYTAVYLPRLNPDHDPADPNSPRFVSGGNADIAIWNGRYFVSQGAIQAEDVTACQGISTAEGRRACYENRVAARSEDNRPTGFNARGIYASHEGHGDIRIRVTDANIRTGTADDIQTPGADAQGIYATHTGRTIVCGARGSGCRVGGGTTPGGGGVSIVVDGGAIDTQGEDSHGIWARHRGDSGADEADGNVDPDDVGTGNVAIAVTDADIDTAGAHASGVYGLIQQTCTGADEDGNCNELVEGTGVGDIDIAVEGGSIDTKGVGGAYAVHARHENTGAIAVRLTGVAAATEGGQAHGVFADHGGSAGAVSVTVDGGSVATQGDDAHGVYGAHAGSGALTVAVTNGAEVTTKGIGAQGVRADHDGSGTLTVNLAGAVTTEGESSEGVLALHRGSGALAIEMTGGKVKTTGFEAHGLYASHTGAAARTVSVTVNGGSVTAEDADSAGVLAHHGAADRAGAVTVTVGQGASVTGGLVGIQLIAYADADGNVPTRTVNVHGTVRGVSDAGIHLPTGGAVNVGATGSVSSASAAIFSLGDYGTAVTVAGAVTGDVLNEGDGDLTFTSQADGTVTGNVHNRGNGDLTADVAGKVTGDVLGLGSGDHTVTVREGGTVGGTVRLAASTVAVGGAAGRVWLENGGVVTVGATGRIAGIQGAAIRSDTGDLTTTLAGALTGDVLALGTGTHRITVVEGGDVKGVVHVATEVVRGDPEKSAVTVNGAVGQLRLPLGGAPTVGPKGRIRGIDGIAISAPGRSVDLLIQEDPGEPPGAALTRVEGGIDAAERSVSLQAPDGSVSLLGLLGATTAAPRGPYDLGLDEDGTPVRAFAPRARVYEALPSVLLGLNEPSTHREWMAAARSSNGAWAAMEVGGGDWKAKRSTSTRNPPGSGIPSASGVSYRSHRRGVRAGIDFPVRGNGLAGVSMHHHRVSAELPRIGIETGIDSEIRAAGTGVGVSGAWRSGKGAYEGVYLDGRAQATWYTADLTSGIRGDLKSGARGVGYAVALEAGRRTETILAGLGEVALTPRARLMGSWVNLKDFADQTDRMGNTGNTVSMGKGRSMTGRAGMSVEVAPAGLGGGRVFGSVDLERALQAKTRISAGGTTLSSKAKPTRVHLELGAAAGWKDGRYAMQATVGYMAGGGGNRDYRGALNLKLRF